jgi:hypothetical protein
MRQTKASLRNDNQIIISVGALPELLALREWVLQSAGYAVLTASPKEAASRVRNGECGVLLLCYSVPVEWRNRLVQRFREHCPGGRIIAITNQPVLETPKEVDALIYGVEGPEALLDVIQANEA